MLEALVTMSVPLPPGRSKSCQEEFAHRAEPLSDISNETRVPMNADDSREGIVMLTPEQQAEFMKAHPKSFTPASGAWGAKGSTRVHLADTTPAIAKRAIAAAYVNKTTAKGRPR